MNTIRIQFKTPMTWIRLILAAAMMIIGLIGILTEGDWSNYGFFFLGILHVIILLVEKKNAFIEFSDSAIQQGKIFSKRIVKTELKEIKDFAGERIFRSSNKEIRFELKHVLEEDRQNLDELTEKLKLSL